MKKVRQAELKTIDGFPFKVPEADKDGQTSIVDGKPKLKVAKLTDLLKTLIYSLPADKLTMQDSIHARRLFEQISTADNDIIPIEDGEHDWLKDKVNEYGPKIFGINAVIVRDAVEDFERIHDKEK